MKVLKSVGILFVGLTLTEHKNQKTWAGRPSVASAQAVDLNQLQQKASQATDAASAAASHASDGAKLVHHDITDSFTESACSALCPVDPARMRRMRRLDEDQSAMASVENAIAAAQDALRAASEGLANLQNSICESNCPPAEEEPDTDGEQEENDSNAGDDAMDNATTGDAEGDSDA